LPGNVIKILLTLKENGGSPMKDTILIRRGGTIIEIPAEQWRKHLAEARHHTATSLPFMTDNHRLVRNFAVRELPRNQGRPLRPEEIAQRLSLPLDLLSTILDDLQKHLFFLVRNHAGEVNWAFPVTADRTSHGLSFSSSEHVFAA
jgi:hypothetical protein